MALVFPTPVAAAIGPSISGTPTLDADTGMLTITFDKSIDVGSIDGSGFHIEMFPTSPVVVTLSDAELDTTSDGTIIQFTLTTSNHQTVIALYTPILNIDENSVSDTAGNGIEPVRDQQLDVVPDILPPTALYTSLHLRENIVGADFIFNEYLDNSSINATKFHIRESGSDSGGITLDSAIFENRQNTNSQQQSKVILLDRDIAQTVLAMTAPTIYIEANAFRDLANHYNEAVYPKIISIRNDTDSAVAVSGNPVLNKDTRALTITFDDTISIYYINPIGFHIRENGTDSGGVTLSDGEFYGRSDNNAIRFTLTESNYQKVLAMTAPTLSIDLIKGSNSTSLAKSNAYISQTIDRPIDVVEIIPPAISGTPILDMGTGVLSIEFTEAVDIGTITATGFQIQESFYRAQSITPSIGATLSDDELDTTTNSTAIQFTLTEHNRQAVIGLDIPRLHIGGNAIRDLSGNGIASVTDHDVSFSGDRISPKISSTPALNEGTGILTIMFDETINPDSISKSMFHIRESGAASGGVQLDDDELDVASNNAAIQFTLTDSNRHAVIALNTPTLYVEQNAISDTSANGIAQISDLQMDITRDTIPPAISGTPALNEGTGVLSMEFTKTVDIGTVTATGFHIRESNDTTVGATLSDGELDTTTNSTAIQFTLTDSNRHAVIALSTPTLYVDQNAISDTSANGIAQISDLQMDITRDTIPPVISDTPILNEETRVLIITFDDIIDISSINTAHFHIRESNDTAGVILSDDELDTTEDGTTIQFTVTELNLVQILEMEVPALDIGADAISDVSGNGIASVSDRMLDITRIPDTISPVITLNGYNPQIVPLDEDYTEYSGTVTDENNDSYMGIVSIDVTALDTTQPGVYTVTYSAPADQAGNTPVPQNRTVIVFDPDANLIQNGSFEEPVLEKSWAIHDQVDPWNIQWNTNNPHVTQDGTCPTDPVLEIQTSKISKSFDGAQLAELDSHCTVRPSTSAAISQDIATEPGQEYTVSFALKKRANTSDDSNGLRVSADGITLDTITEMSTAWQTHTVQFTAQNDTATVSFADIGAPDTYGTLLDSISVTKTGETANLLQNGSFEDVTVTEHGSAWQLFDSEQTPGWSVSWNTDNPNASAPACPAAPVLEIQQWVSGGAESGSYHAELDTHCYSSLHTSVAISQTIHTVPGVQYELSWHSRDRPGTEEGTNGLDVLLDGQLISDIQLTQNWGKNTHSFVADSTGTTITFADTGIPDTYGTLLDGIFVSPVANN